MSTIARNVKRLIGIVLAIACGVLAFGRPQWRAELRGQTSAKVTSFQNYTSAIYKQPPGCPPFFADGSGKPQPLRNVPIAGTQFTGWYMGHEDRHSESYGMSHWLTVDLWCMDQRAFRADGAVAVEFYKLVATRAWTGGMPPARDQARAPGAT